MNMKCQSWISKLKWKKTILKENTSKKKLYIRPIIWSYGHVVINIIQTTWWPIKYRNYIPTDISCYRSIDQRGKTRYSNSFIQLSSLFEWFQAAIQIAAGGQCLVTKAGFDFRSGKIRCPRTQQEEWVPQMVHSHSYISMVHSLRRSIMRWKNKNRGEEVWLMREEDERYTLLPSSHFIKVNSYRGQAIGWRTD